MSQIYFSDSAPTSIKKTYDANDLDGFGKFTDPEVETEFRAISLSSDVVSARIVIGTSLAFLPVLFNDFLFHGWSPIFWTLAALRLGVFLISLTALVAVARVSVKMFDTLVIAWSVSAVVLELFVVVARPPGFFGVIATTSFIISVLFLLVPQPLIRQLLLAGVLSIGHMILSLWIYPITDPVVFNTFLLVICASNAVGYFSSRAMQISKRRQFVLGKELAASEKHYRTLVQASRGLVWTMQGDGTVDFVRGSGLGLGVDAARAPIDISGIADVVHPNDRSDFLDGIKQATSTGGEMDWTGRVINSDGEYRWVLTRIVPLSISSEKPGKWLGTTTDIHDFWTARMDLAEANNELEKSLARVRQLETLLAICGFCKKIRDENGQWQDIESYISHRSETRFSHGVCPGCGIENYGDVWENALGGRAN
jgi:PAS domain S-box-containing protein